MLTLSSMFAEAAWQLGFDVQGAEQLDGCVQGTKVGCAISNSLPTLSMVGACQKGVTLSLTHSLPVACRSGWAPQSVQHCCAALDCELKLWTLAWPNSSSSKQPQQRLPAPD
jgi:hypothetical protein